jgi:RNase P/RNase MRP subunit POP5
LSGVYEKLAQQQKKAHCASCQAGRVMKSSLNDNFRYLLLKLHFAGENSALQKSLNEEPNRLMLEFFGIEGMAQIQPRIMRDAPAPPGCVVVRCIRGQERRLAQGLLLISNLEGKNLRFEVKGISGTIKALLS